MADSEKSRNISYSFKKYERLTHKNIIQELFSKGSSFYLYPIRVKYLPTDSFTGVKIVTAVSKKSLRKAVDRNAVKRKLREVYRLNKYKIENGLPNDKKGLAIVFIYLEKRVLSYELIENKLNLVIDQLLIDLKKL